MSEHNEAISATISPDEQLVLDHLAHAYNAMLKLTVLHQADLPEFTTAIHAAQKIVLARVGLRSTQRKYVADAPEAVKRYVAEFDQRAFARLTDED